MDISVVLVVLGAAFLHAFWSMLATAEGQNGAKGLITGMASFSLLFGSHFKQQYVKLVMSRGEIDGHSGRFFIRARWRDCEATG